MPAQQQHTVWTAYLSSAAGSVSAGTCLVLAATAGDGYIVATSANRTAAGRRSAGIALTAGDEDDTAVEIQTVGIVDKSIAGLGTGTDSWIRVSSAGVLERCTPSGSDDVVGRCNTDGTAYVIFGLFTADIVATSASLPIDLTTGVTGTLPVANGGTGIASFGAGVATFLGTPSSANLRSALTDETGTGAAVFANAPDLIGPRIQDFDASHWYTIGGSNLAANRTIYLPFLGADDILVAEATTQTLTNKTIAGASNTLSVRIANDVTGLGANVATFLGTPSSANLAAAVTGETGSGALVFGTSPTIDSPTISGTPVFSATSIQATGNARRKVYTDIASVQTTNATVTSLFTWTVTDECVTTVVVEIDAIQSTGATTASYVRRVRIKRDGGTVTVGTVEDSFTDEEAGFATCDVTVDNSGTTGRVRVTGIAATTIDWSCTVTRTETTHA